MSTESDADDRRTPGQLLAMDEETARRTLTVDEFHRWEKVNDLHAQADDKRAEWADEDQRVTDITVNADKQALGTSFDLYGNDVLLHFSADDDRVVELQERADGRLDGEDDIDDLDSEAIDELTDDLLDLLDIMLLEWNGHDWETTAEHERRAVLEQAREAWGIESLYLGVAEAAAAVAEDREERVGVIESFRGEERGQRR